MASSQRYGNSSTGNGRNIAVVAIATASGVAALFAYHTSPGHADALTGTMTSSTMTAADGTGTAAGASAGTKPAAGQSAAARSGTGTTKHKTQHGGTKASAAAGAAAGSGAAQTFTGKAANTRWGVVQVKITVQNGKIVAASAPVSPHSTQHSVEINTNAVPILNQEAVKAGSAKIDAVSGATVTSGGYVESLQSAIDMAHL